MAKWNRGEFDPNEKVRIVLIVDPKDPDNEELLKFHREIPWGAGNNTYLSIIRESAQVKGSGASKGKQRGSANAQPRKATAMSEVAPAAPAPAAPTQPNKVGTEPVEEIRQAHANEETVTDAKQKTSFSERAANQFDMADDD